MLSRTLLAIAIGASITFTGCTKAVDVRQEVVYDVQVGAYDRAIPKVNELYDSVRAGELAEPGDKEPAKADDIEEKNELLWRMERGAIEAARLADAQALSHLDRASQLVVERRTESLTRAVGTYLANDTASEYAGNGYEHVMVDYLRALNHAIAAQRLQGILPAAGAEAESLDDAVQAMRVIARGMVLEKIQFNQDNAPDLRYFDDPFARTFAAAVMLAAPPELRGRDDEGFAFAQLTKALHAYRDQQKKLGNDGQNRYEIAGIPGVALRLAAIVGRSYNPGGLADLLKEVGVAGDDPSLGAPLTKDQGLILVLNQADWITPTDVLSIDLKINVPWVPTVTEAEKQRGVTLHGWYTYAGTVFYAKGPNAEFASQGWGAAVAGIAEIARICEIANPGTWIGFEVPTHRADAPIPAPGSVTVDTTQVPLAVVADIDAYARATLKDRQPSILAKTLTRVFIKHITAIIAEKAMEAGAKNKDGSEDPGKKLAAKLLGTTSHAAASASESADTRHWALLPDRVEASLITAPAGKHHVSISTAAGTRDLGEITVPAGRLVIVPARTFPHPVPNPYPANAPENAPPASAAASTGTVPAKPADAPAKPADAPAKPAAPAPAK